jgi:hypothetical protein
MLDKRKKQQAKSLKSFLDPNASFVGRERKNPIGLSSGSHLQFAVSSGPLRYVKESVEDNPSLLRDSKERLLSALTLHPHTGQEESRPKEMASLLLRHGYRVEMDPSCLFAAVYGLLDRSNLLLAQFLAYKMPDINITGILEWESQL